MINGVIESMALCCRVAEVSWPLPIIPYIYFMELYQIVFEVLAYGRWKGPELEKNSILQMKDMFSDNLMAGYVAQSWSTVYLSLVKTYEKLVELQ